MQEVMILEGHIVAEISVAPLGTGSTSLSHYVAGCMEVLEGREDISYQLTPMGTVIEGPLDRVLEIARLLHEVPFGKGASRVITTLRIDDRRDKVSTMAGKINSVLKLHPKTRTGRS
jgi:uncharacterized protein (TIGR00106 family)